MEQRLLLINLLLKLGVATAVASGLVRSVEFKSLLFREDRSAKQRIYLVLWVGIPLAIAVWIRFIQKSFLAGDLSFETTVLLGVIVVGELALRIAPVEVRVVHNQIAREARQVA